MSTVLGLPALSFWLAGHQVFLWILERPSLLSDQKGNQNLLLPQDKS